MATPRHLEALEAVGTAIASLDFAAARQQVAKLEQLMDQEAANLAVLIAAAFMSFTRVVDMTGHRSTMVAVGAKVLTAAAAVRQALPYLLPIAAVSILAIVKSR